MSETLSRPAVHSLLPAHLQKRFAARDAERRSRRDDLADGSEVGSQDAVAYFQKFQAQRTQLEDSLQKLSRQGLAGQQEAPEELQRLESDINSLDQAIVKASSFLPHHDQASYQTALLGLRRSLQAARGLSKPPGKFSFSKRAASRAQPQGTGEAATASHTAHLSEAAAPNGSAPGASRKHHDSASSSGASDDLAGTCSQAEPAGQGTSRGNAARQQPLGSVCGRHDEEILRGPPELEGRDVLLQDLTGCTLRLHGAMASLRIDRVERCTIHTGPVQGAAFVQEVRDSMLILAAHQVRMHSSTNVTARLRVGSNPVVEGCKGMQFGPYTLSFPGLPELLSAAGLQEDNQNWGDVLDFGWIKSSPSPNWSLIAEAPDSL
ncbi:hypothetical protein WJX74_004595 [Apatococcus lobatus]|uniref:C-CAP/cofactor C-like domain-containing protein n=1 Tax=Apatococcus lobatus TaxID=904363 RepID=A0AAW1S3J1_9CHLO